MKRNIAGMVCLSAVLVLGLAVVASAEEDRCSHHALVGAWAYTENGTVMAPAPTGGTAPILAGAVGRYDFESDGNFTGRQHSSSNGAVVEDLKLGTWELNSDCTVTLTIKIYDPTGTTLRRTSVWFVVLDDNATEFRGIMLSMVLPPPNSGVPLGPIMTMTGTRLFHDHDRD